ncbi:deoxyribodipyrimidine photo-lyase [Armatimonas sp.]|uniref:cryptochrome/photolyase family protein n=1 Tax=Armatimonas sp. TaxID=1872638 RepID=UPI00286A14A0|nr:deoxyribodipyrimidine photo-lyase [Armatimonas sp.]
MFVFQAMPHKTALIWFRRTLRLSDNLALLAALDESEKIVPVFILDPAILSRPDTGERRVAFLYEGLRVLDAALRERGSYLVVRHGKPDEELARLAQETGATAVYFSREYGPRGRERDATISQIPLECHVSSDHLLAEPESILSKAGTPYTVFTPYFRVWQEQAFRTPRPAPVHIPTPLGIASEPFSESSGSPASLPAGEHAAETQLVMFSSTSMENYDTQREFPAVLGTSQLSAYLKFGMLSPRRALEAARRSPKSAGKDAWIRQLAWRDFYYQILWHFPHVATGSFKPQFDAIAWHNEEELFSAWQRGETGYPFIDAAMRQLAQTGQMHNRARMAVASFLTKDLLCDWRWGEQHFMQQLLDGDQAANNGGWQWAAGTGTDAQPYFRIFNPVSQGEKFDADGAYVKYWCPELKRVPPKWVHKPWELSLNEQAAVNCTIGKHYPARLVDHGEQRVKALALYKVVAKGNDE